MKFFAYLLFVLLALGLPGRPHQARPAPVRQAPVPRVLRSPQAPKVVRLVNG